MPCHAMPCHAMSRHDPRLLLLLLLSQLRKILRASIHEESGAMAYKLLANAVEAALPPLVLEVGQFVIMTRRVRVV